VTNVDTADVNAVWFKRQPGRDQGDWALNSEAFQRVLQIWNKAGTKARRHPLSVDGASDVNGFNAKYLEYYTKENSFERATVQELYGKGVYINPDFRKVGMYLSKLESLWHDNCDIDVCMVLPCDERRAWYPLLKKHFECVHVFSKSWRSSDDNYLFSRPVLGRPQERESPGPPPFDVAVWFSKPHHVHKFQPTIMNSSTGNSYAEPVKYMPHLNVIPININGRILSCLLDDGAQCSLINKSVVELLKLPVAECSASLGWLDSTSVPITHAVQQLQFTIHGNQFQTDNVLVTQLHTYDMILGLPFRLATEMHALYTKTSRRFVCTSSHGRRVSFVASPHYIKPLTHRHSQQTISVCTMQEALRLRAYGAELFWVWPNQ